MLIPPNLIQIQIKGFCEKFSRELSGMSDPGKCIELAGSSLSELLLNRALMAGLMHNMVSGAGYPDLGKPTLFDNEVVLFLEESRAFSLRLYLWGPGEFTPPHDHNSWGVLGTVSAGFESINYRREDDGLREGYAKLKELDKRQLQAGETVFTLPLNAGIHKTGNPTEETIITISIYGPSVGRGYIQGFDLVRNRVYRLVSPRHKKVLLATRALKSLESV